MTCPTPAEIHARLGQGDPESRLALLEHAADCARCRGIVDAVLAFEEPESALERRKLEGLALPADVIVERAMGQEGARMGGPVAREGGPGASRLQSNVRELPSGVRGPAMSAGGLQPGARTGWSRRWLVPAGGLAVLAAAAAVVLLPPGGPFRGRGEEEALAELQGPARAQEAAFSELPWAPFEPRRGAGDEAAFDRPLRRLLEAREQRRPGADRALAMLFHLRGAAGDAARTDKALLAAGTDAPSENDRGVVLYARGDFEGALELFDRALAQEPRFAPARFNRGLALGRLGLREAATDAFEKLVDGPPGWAKEAAERARRLRLPRAAPAPSTARLEVIRALAAAASPDEVAAARALLAKVPAGMAADLTALAALAARQPASGLAQHGERWKRYLALRERAVRGAVDPAEAEQFATSPQVAADPVLWAPALQLAGFVQQARGQWRAAERFVAAVAQGCRKQPCAVENEAIALDELADAAGRGGDFATAHRLQDRAEALLAGVAAELQLAELHRKRAQLLAAERRFDDAAVAAGRAVRALEGAPDTADGLAARAVALGQAASIAAERAHPRSASELRQAALSIARRGDLKDIEVEAAIALATSAAEGAHGADGRAQLLAEIARLSPSGHQNSVASLRSHLAVLLELAGDGAAALAEAEQGLLAGKDVETSDRVRLHLAHARALRRLGREDDAIAELRTTVDELSRTVRGAPDPAGVARAGDETVAELAAALLHAGRAPEEIALPLDRLRAAMLGIDAVSEGWSRGLPEGSCVLAVLPSPRGTVTALITREGAEGHVLEQGGDELAALQPAELSAKLLPGVARCTSGLWIFAGAPLDRTDLSALPLGGKPLGRQLPVGAASSLSRVLAREETGTGALIVRDAQAQGDSAGTEGALPSTPRESAALQAAFGQIAELAGPAATPEAVLARAPSASMLHFAVHGFDSAEGGSLALSGPAGRLSGREIQGLALRRSTRVVLSACEAATPGPRGLSWAFAKAGAVAVAAARDRVDDAAAARWAEVFYAALARGASFAEANREAVSDPRAAWFVVMK